MMCYAVRGVCVVAFAGGLLASAGHVCVGRAVVQAGVVEEEPSVPAIFLDDPPPRIKVEGWGSWLKSRLKDRPDVDVEVTPEKLAGTWTTFEYEDHEIMTMTMTTTTVTYTKDGYFTVHIAEPEPKIKTGRYVIKGR